MTTSRFKREELHTAVVRAIAESVGPPGLSRDEQTAAAGAVVRVVLSEAQRVVREFPLNICGYGGPMPADHAASIEQFRDAVLVALEEHA